MKCCVAVWRVNDVCEMVGSFEERAGSEEAFLGGKWSAEEVGEAKDGLV